jgi:hypothetical protein
MEFPSPPAPDDHRPRWVPALIAVLAVLAVALRVAVYLLTRHGRPAGAPEAIPSASSPSAPAGPVSPRPTGRGTVPDGRITLVELRNATLDLPPWPADNVRGPSGRIRLHDGRVLLAPRTAPTGQAPYGTDIVLLSVAYGDVDHDGAQETIAEFGCVIVGGSQQLVALDRNRSGGLVTLGQVVATTGEIRDIEPGSARVDGSGTVTARVADYQGCCDDRTPRLTQRRGYRLTGGRFVQVSGPARMPFNRYVTETSLTAGTLRLGPPVDGVRYGTLEVTATHVRGAHPSRLTLTFALPEGLQPWGAHWPPSATPGETVTVTVTAPPAYGRTTYSFAFRRPAAVTGGSVVVDSQASSAEVPALSETVSWDNGATAPIRTID